MPTKTKKPVVTGSQINTGTDMKPSLPNTLVVLQFLRTAKGKSDAEIHAKLNIALAECKKANSVLLLERIMLHIGDVSRQHNILTELGIVSKSGGAQERAIFRSILRWWESNLPESFAKNIRVFAEYSLYENLMYFQNTTDRYQGKLLSSEQFFPMPAKVYDFLATQIRTGKDLNLIARHLPAYQTGKLRVAKYVVKSPKGKNLTTLEYKVPTDKDWVKVNGVLVSGTITIKVGDIITYPRAKQAITLSKQKTVNTWVINFCKNMDWSISDYKKFRSLQNTPEQKFSSKSILNLAKSDFDELLNGLTGGQRFRVAKMVARKDKNTGQLVPRAKWDKLGEYYIDWEKAQEQVANKLRAAASTGDVLAKKQLEKEFKVKATGIQTIDLLVSLFKGSQTDMQINNTYQAMIEKMDLIANVFPVIDGSGSMDSSIRMDSGQIKVSYRQIVYAMAIAFSTRNPVEAFRNTYGWFSNNFVICGNSKFVDNSPNPYVARASFRKEVKRGETINASKTFTENLAALKAADPQDVSSTNMFSTIEYFVALVKTGKYHVEDLPNAILYLTDMENNTGRSPKEAITLAATIGWAPLMIFWSVQDSGRQMQTQFKDVPNCLFIGGFNESCLSQILRGIKVGSIDPQLELWSIYDDVRYSVIK